MRYTKERKLKEEEMMNEDRLIKQFLELVQIDSESGDERKVADYLKSELEKMGFMVEEDHAGEKIGGNAGNVIARKKGNKNAKSCFFCAHMDTVKPGNGVKPKLENGIITSDGTTVLGGDDKGGIAAILEGVRSYLEENKEYGDIQLAFTIGEEEGLIGAKALDYKSLWQIDGAFFFDSGDDSSHIVVRAPEHYDFAATFKGLAAHAGLEPEKGINAIMVAAEAIRNMNLGRIDEETTANIGEIAGGKATNIVPDEATIKGESRSLNKAKVEAQIAAMQKACEAAAAKFGAQVELDIAKSHDAINVSLDSATALMAKEACALLGLEAQFITTGGGSDANIMNGYGIDAVNIGIGMSKVHTTEEFIALKDLVLGANMVKTLLEVAGK